jgi:hypothetical protein
MMGEVLEQLAQRWCVLRGYALSRFAPKDEDCLCFANLNILHPEVLTPDSIREKPRRTHNGCAMPAITGKP